MVHYKIIILSVCISPVWCHKNDYYSTVLFWLYAFVVCKCCVGVVYELVCELVGSRRIRL